MFDQTNDFLNSGNKAPNMRGPRGQRGQKGDDGKSPFEEWKAIAGNENKTLDDFLLTLQGPQGGIGPTGTVGPAGSSIQGPKGDKGDAGSPGIQGPQGAAGATGATGPAGADTPNMHTHNNKPVLDRFSFHNAGETELQWDGHRIFPVDSSSGTPDIGALDDLTDVSKGTVVDGEDYVLRADANGDLTLEQAQDIDASNFVSQADFDTEQAARTAEDAAQDTAIAAAQNTADSKVSQADFDTEQAARTAEDTAQDTAIAAAQATGNAALERSVFGSYSGLIQNGTFLQGDATNFYGGAFDDTHAVKFNSVGSITANSAVGIGSIETVSVVASQKYRLSLDYLVEDALDATTWNCYVFTAFYDAAGLAIFHRNGNIRYGTSGAVLSADINIGDTSISVVSHDFVVGGLYNNTIKLPYKQSDGALLNYNGTPYSRKFLGSPSEDVIDWANNTATSIALKRPVTAGETALSGETIWQATHGGSYVYVTPTVAAADGQPLGADVVPGVTSAMKSSGEGRVFNFSWGLDGVAEYSTPWTAGKIPPGTASVAMGILPRHSASGGANLGFNVYLSNFNMFQIP